MSKGNLILGTARGKVGDVVQYRRLGEQATRIYVKEVANPKSQSQSAQRLKLNPAQKFYQGFQEILNHSWQSVPYGMRSYAYFLKQAMKSQAGPYVEKGNTEIIPWTYPVSHGSLQSFGVVQASFQRFVANEKDLTNNTLNPMEASTTFLLPNNPTYESVFDKGETPTWGQISKTILEGNSDLQNGDQITVLAMSVDCKTKKIQYGYKINSFADSLNTVCRYRRCVLDTASTVLANFNDTLLLPPIQATIAGDKKYYYFPAEGRISVNLNPFIHASGIQNITSMPVAMAIIVSRKQGNTWMRSSAKMQVYSQLLEKFGNSDAANNAINSYSANQTIALTSERYLNNSDKKEAYAVTYTGDVLADGSTPKITTMSAKATDGGTEIPVVVGYNSLTKQNEVITDEGGYIIVPVNTPNGTLMGLNSLEVPSNSDWTQLAKVGGTNEEPTFSLIEASELRRVANGTWGTNRQYYISNNINIL